MMNYCCSISVSMLMLHVLPEGIVQGIFLKTGIFCQTEWSLENVLKTTVSSCNRQFWTNAGGAAARASDKSCTCWSVHVCGLSLICAAQNELKFCLKSSIFSKSDLFFFFFLLFFLERKGQGLQEPDNQIFGGNSTVSAAGNPNYFSHFCLTHSRAVIYQHWRVLTEHSSIIFKLFILLITFQLIKFWEAFLPEAKAIAW